jgi:hypothetical protein
MRDQVENGIDWNGHAHAWNWQKTDKIRCVHMTLCNCVVTASSSHQAQTGQDSTSHHRHDRGRWRSVYHGKPRLLVDKGEAKGKEAPNGPAFSSRSIYIHTGDGITGYPYPWIWRVAMQSTMKPWMELGPLDHSILSVKGKSNAPLSDWSGSDALLRIGAFIGCSKTRATDAADWPIGDRAIKRPPRADFSKLQKQNSTISFTGRIFLLLQPHKNTPSWGQHNHISYHTIPSRWARHEISLIPDSCCNPYIPYSAQYQARSIPSRCVMILALGLQLYCYVWEAAAAATVVSGAF